MRDHFNFEKEYLQLAKDIISIWERVKGRNGTTRSLFWMQLVVDTLRFGFFPLLTTRQIFYKGVLWEFAAFMRGPKTVQDFKDFNCNYWDMWGDRKGNINVDYWNKWLNFNWKNQLLELISKIKKEPTSRRLIVNGWDPASVDSLSLPCCHYSYQFSVRSGAYLDILWTQRSADFMVGLPSDIVLAATWLIVLAKETGYIPGRIIMSLWDTHIYEEHIDAALQQMKQSILPLPQFNISPETSLFGFVPEDLQIIDYKHGPKIPYLLKL